MQEIKKADETGTPLIVFVGKNDRRTSIILFILGFYLLTSSIWSSIMFQGESNLEVFIVIEVISGTFFCILAILNPTIDRWRVARLNGIPLPPLGWEMIALSFIWVLILLLNIRTVTYDPHSDWTSNPLNLMSFFYYLAFLVFYLIGLFLVMIPQARRSFHLSFRLHLRVFDNIKTKSISMDCWREERISNIITRLLCNSSFKRTLAKFQITPAPQIRLLHQKMMLDPESTPTKAGFKWYTPLVVAFGEENV